MPLNFKKLFSLFLFGSLFPSASLLSQDENSAEAKSYFKLSVDYLSNAVYYGRRDSLAVPYIAPTFTYHNKSGFYAEASLSYLASKGAGQVDATSLTAGFDYASKNEKLQGDAYISKYFYNSASYSVYSEVKSSIANTLTYNTGPVSINSVIDLSFSGKTDVNTSLGLSHSFDISNDGNWSVVPAALVDAGTQNFYENYFTKRKYAVKRRRRAATASSVIIIGKNFSVLDYEFSSPLYYDGKKFGLFVTPTFSVPINPIKFSLNNGNTYTTEKLRNSFYIEIGAYVKL